MMACALALLLAACGGGAGTGGVTSTTAPAATTASAATAPVAPASTVAPAATTAPAPAPASGSAQDAVLAAFRKQFASGPYRSQTTITSDKSTTEIMGEMIPPDRMHVKRTTAKGVSEQIYIGKKGWSRVGAGAWTPVDGNLMATFMAQIDGSSLRNIEAITTDVKATGADQVDGAKALVYSYVLDMSKASTPLDLKTNNKVWINETTGLIMKIESDGAFQGVHSKTVQTVSYDPSITIEPPVK
jgi:hypothetical protein